MITNETRLVLGIVHGLVLAGFFRLIVSLAGGQLE